MARRAGVEDNVETDEEKMHKEEDKCEGSLKSRVATDLQGRRSCISLTRSGGASAGSAGGHRGTSRRGTRIKMKHLEDSPLHVCVCVCARARVCVCMRSPAGCLIVPRVRVAAAVFQDCVRYEPDGQVIFLPKVGANNALRQLSYAPRISISLLYMSRHEFDVADDDERERARRNESMNL